MELGELAELRDDPFPFPRRQMRQIATIIMTAMTTADMARITGRVGAENMLELLLPR